MARASSLFAVLALGAAACEPGERAIRIDFEGRVGASPFECGRSYDGVGTTGSTLTALDLRFYVHDVRGVTAGGAEVPIRLLDDGVWQSGGVALLDFERGDGCEGGNAPVNTALVGAVPASAPPITGLRFRLGVPEARNHLDSASAPSPLNLTSMFWSWQAGYKFLRVEGRSTGQPAGFRFHLGATGCTGDAFMGTRTCANGNRPEVRLDALDPDAQVVVADLAALFAESDLDADAGGSPGCMSEVDDPECATLFEALGIGDPGAQRFFRAEPRLTR